MRIKRCSCPCAFEASCLEAKVEIPYLLNLASVHFQALSGLSPKQYPPVVGWVDFRAGGGKFVTTR